MEARFVLNEAEVVRRVNMLKELGLKINYSYKTNHEVGDVIYEKCEDVDFSIHAFDEIKMIKDASRIHFFTQAESKDELKELFDFGIRNFVVDNEVDLGRIIEAVEEAGIKINLSLRMKFLEHRIGSGKYYVYGMSSAVVNDWIRKLKDFEGVDGLGVHIHRKSQNVSEWEIVSEIEDSLEEDVLERVDVLNMGGGLPANYISFNDKSYGYIFEKIKKAVSWLKEKDIEAVIEPGRFIAAPSVRLEVEVIQVQGRNVIVNTTIYNCALDTVLTGTKMMVEGEGEGEDYLIKGNSPTRDDIFRYNVKLKDVDVGRKIVFLNAGAYNYTTDFFGYKKLKVVYEKE